MTFHQRLVINIPVKCRSKKHHQINSGPVYGVAIQMWLCTALLALYGWLLPVQGMAADKADVVKTFTNGHINWSAGFFISRGVATPPAKKEAKEPKAYEEALAQARALALHHMRDMVLKTRIDSLNLVGRTASANGLMMARVESLVKSAKAVKQEYLSDGTVEVTMQMPMYGGFAQLVLPEEIKQIESIKTVSNANGKPEKGQQGSRADIGAKTYTGLVVDARGIQFSPAMAPVIVDEKTREVYGSAFVSREFAVQQGMSGYSRDMQTAGRDPRVSGNPLLVKGLGTVANSPSTIIISNADASKIKSASEHISFLKKCRVMIVAD